MTSATDKLEAEKSSPEPVPAKSTSREYLESLVVTVILALYGTTFLVQAFKIPSSSMEDTLLIGDHLMVDKVTYAPGSFWRVFLPYYSVERDQVIVFRYPLDPGTYFVKRVVGVPGDRIRLNNKLVYRNGTALDEPFAVHKSSRTDDFRDNFPTLSSAGYPEWIERLPEYMEDGEMVVPPGHYFVMGDNRDFSSDSRYWGFVPRANIVGNPLVIYWSYETSSEDYRNNSVSDYVVKLVDVVFHFPQKTRWKRMFRLVN